MTKPTLEQMYAWRKDMTERLSAPARLNAIYEPIEIGEPNATSSERTRNSAG